MKSIKEKAEEYAPYTKDDSWHRIRAAINAQASYEAGANYVLDEIETIIKADLGSYKSQLDRIKNVIEQLKK